MKITNFIAEKTIKTAHALDLYSPELANIRIDPFYEQSLVVTLVELVKFVLFSLLAPIIAFTSAIRLARSLSKRISFSLLLAVYNAFLRIFIISILSALFYVYAQLISEVFYYGVDIDGLLRGYFSGGMLVFILSTSIIFGIVFLFFSGKNINFLKLAFAFILVIPAILIFLIVFILKFFPPFKKYLPHDSIEAEES